MQGFTHASPRKLTSLSSRSTAAVSAALLVSAGMLLGVSARPAAAQGPSGLHAFYTFDDGTANDVTGNGRHGTLGNGSGGNAPTFLNNGGYEGGAFQFSASLSSFIQLPVNINAAALPQVTIGGWFRADSAAAIQTLISHDNGGFDRTLNIDTRGGGGATWSAFTGSGVRSSGVPVTSGQWVFVAFAHDQQAGSLTLDVNGTRVSASNATFGTSVYNAFIGRNPGFGEYFNGAADNVFVYDRALSGQELDTIRTGGASVIHSTTAVPEPGSLALAASVLPLVGLIALRARRAR